ncbi:MAG: serine/threonine-protein kinase [Planctomycetota bacterium]
MRGSEHETKTNAQVEDLLVRCLDAHERGDRAALDAILRGHPEHVALIRAALANLDGGPTTAATIPPFATSPPAVLGDFEILGELGRGGMGIVYEARQRSLGRRVALKVLPPCFTLDAKAVARFQREGLAAARLRHSGIVPIHAVGEEQGCHWYAMDVVPGAPLNAVLDDLRRRAIAHLDGADVGRVVDALVQEPAKDTEHVSVTASTASTLVDPWSASFVATMLELGAQVADALAAAHEAGVVHRDVKPSNILVRRDGRAVLVDFGLAVFEAAPTLTRSGGFLGTPSYMAPEQAVDARAADARSDVFSLGATLYEMVTLRRPFAGDSDAEVLHALRNNEPTSVQRLQPAATTDLAAVLDKALEKDPLRRYASAAALAADLRAVLRHQPVSARSITPLGRVRRWTRREPLKAILAALLLLGVPVVAALGGVLYARRPLVAFAEQRLRSERTEAHLLHGVLQMLSGSPAEGVITLRAARAEAPEDPEVAALEVLALAHAGRAEAATAALAGGRSTWPSTTTRAWIEVACLAAGRDPIAADVKRRGLGEPEGGIELTMAALAEQARTADRVDFAALRRAQRWLERAILLAPRPRPHLLCALAHVLHFTHDADTARATADALAAHWPDDVAAMLAQARARALYDPAAAVSLYRRARGGGAAETAVRIGLSAALEALGDRTGARDLLREVPDDDPNHYLAQYDLGRLAFDDGDMDAAETHYRAALHARPQHLSTALGLGNVLARRGEHQAALDLLRPFVERLTGSVRLQNNYAESLIAVGQSEQALPYLDRAIAADPTYDYASLTKAIALKRLGRSREAHEELLRAVRERPERAMRWRSLALFHLQDESFPERDLDLALDALRRAAMLTDGAANRCMLRSDAVEVLLAMERYADARQEIDRLREELSAATDPLSRKLLVNLQNQDETCRHHGH